MLTPALFFWVASFDSGEDVKVCVSFPSGQLKKVLCRAPFNWIYLYPMSRFFILIFSKPNLHTIFFFF